MQERTVRDDAQEEIEPLSTNIADDSVIDNSVASSKTDGVPLIGDTASSSSVVGESPSLGSEDGSASKPNRGPFRRFLRKVRNVHASIPNEWGQRRTNTLSRRR